MGQQQAMTIINIKTLKAGENTISKTLAKLNAYQKKRIPTAWKNIKMMIVCKKGNKIDRRNYRPTCLLSNIYKALTKILTKRLEKTFHATLPREKARFRNGYSTTDHDVINQLNEKCR